MNKRKAFIPITALMAALLIALFTGVFSASPFGEVELAHAQARDDARLSSLSISGVALSPAYNINNPRNDRQAANQQPYRARVTSGVSSVKVTAGPYNSKSTVVINAVTNTTPGTEAQTVTLQNAGSSTTIPVVVTAEDGSTTKTYRIVLYRENTTGSTDKVLSSWNLYEAVGTDGDVDATSADVLSGVDVAASAEGRVSSHSIEKLYLVVANAASARISVKGLHYTSSIPAADPVAIELGNKGAKTTFRITVTPEDGGSAATHTIKVYRPRDPESNDNTLSALSLGSGVTLVPPFDKSKTSYTARVGYDIGEASLTYTLNDTAGGASARRIAPDPSDEADLRSDVAGDQIALGAGASKVITVGVTPESGAASTDTGDDCAATNPDAKVKCYTVTVYRENLKKSDNANLAASDAGLTLSVGGTATALTPAYDATVTEYTHTVANTVKQVTVGVTLADTAGGASSEISPADADANTAGHQVNLNSGGLDTVITVTVTAEDGSTKDYTLTVYRERLQKSDVDTLISLTLTDASGNTQELKPEFASGTTSYNARVVNSVAVVTVASEPTDTGASSRVTSPADADANTAGHQVNLTEGAEVNIIVGVTPETGAASTDTGDDCAATSPDASVKCYTVTVYRENVTLSDNANLAAADNTPPGLTLSPAGTMTPAYSPSTTDYRVVVGNGVGSVTVGATVAETGASLEIMPADANSGLAGHQVIPAVGAETEVTITVTAEDGSMKTYTIVLYRQNSPASTDAALSDVNMSGVELTTAWDPAVMTHTARAAYSTETTTLSYAIHPGATVDVQVGRDTGTLIDVSESRTSSSFRIYSTGETKIQVEVTAESGSMDTYTITVSRESAASSEAKLSALELSGVTIDFDADTMAYTDTVGGDVESTTVKAMASLGADIEIMPADADADMDGHQVALSKGNNTVTVTVTSEDDSATNIYTVTIGVGSDDADLSALSLDVSGMTPDFDAATTMYTASVGGDVESVTVTATANDANASVSGAGMQMLDMGENTITVTVTAENGTTKAYTIEVTRRSLTPQQRLLGMYDADRDGMIDIDEVSAALDDFFDGNLSADDLNVIIDLYFG